MRRMNYPRFDKPTYVGTFVEQESKFVINSIPEPGFYFVVINDLQDQYSCTFTIEIDKHTYSSWYSIGLTKQISIDYNSEYGNSISVNVSEGGPSVYEGSTIELYKLN